ncbi:MAG TPA: Dyp-type peroxidase, partial [Jatrophihabitantaceae bacterium]|nr:Dyp-type peroxidase [Jatrophihabitantaceae bacterium]
MTGQVAVTEEIAEGARRTSRRRFLGGAIGAAGVLAAGGAGFGIAHAVDAPSQPAPASGAVPFYGPHQAGIATPAQDRLAFAAFDVTTADRQGLATMLGSWAAAAARMTAAQPIGADSLSPQAPPIDTGEALGLAPARLTVTVGFGPSLFDHRFGLAARRPAALADLPPLPGDALDPAKSGGDICVQACADDPQVAFHVIRNFARIARGTAVMRWSELGFGRTA